LIVTFRPLHRLTIEIMCRVSLTSGLLIVALAASCSACVAGWGTPPANACNDAPTGQECARQAACNPTAASSHGRPVLKSQSGRCNMRGLVQFQFAAFRAFELSAPLLRDAGKIAVPLGPTIVVSSIGSPESDRGPPNS
jgi:hypothetical protein